jgi:hypothetical protein
MFGFFFVLILAQATPMASTPPSPSSGPLAGWTTVAPADPTEYSHYIRHEADDTDSMLSGVRRVCDCQVDSLLSQLTRAFTMLSKGSAVESRTSLRLCGQPAEKLVVTGLASATNSMRNMEVIAFRDRDALVTVSYTFRYASPMPDAERVLTTLCPVNT